MSRIRDQRANMYVFLASHPLTLYLGKVLPQDFLQGALAFTGGFPTSSMFAGLPFLCDFAYPNQPQPNHPNISSVSLSTALITA